MSPVDAARALAAGVLVALMLKRRDPVPPVECYSPEPEKLIGAHDASGEGWKTPEPPA